MTGQNPGYARATGIHLRIVLVAGQSVTGKLYLYVFEVNIILAEETLLLGIESYLKDGFQFITSV